MRLFTRKPKRNETLDSTVAGVALITDYSPMSVISEEFRTLRTNIMYSDADKSIKTLSITSAGASEGKSTVSGNVAVTFANQGLRTLLIDGDMRRPTLHATFGFQNTMGLVDLLTGDEGDDKYGMAVRPTNIENLSILPSGPVPPNPAELLNSKRMMRVTSKLGMQFDFIIFDLPPLTRVTDAQVVASKTDATMLVVPYGIAEKGMVEEARDLLVRVEANVIGVVVNRYPIREQSGYYGYYGAGEASEGTK